MQQHSASLSLGHGHSGKPTDQQRAAMAASIMRSSVLFPDMIRERVLRSVCCGGSMHVHGSVQNRSAQPPQRVPELSTPAPHPTRTADNLILYTAAGVVVDVDDDNLRACIALCLIKGHFRIVLRALRRGWCRRAADVIIRCHRRRRRNEYEPCISVRLRDGGGGGATCEGVPHFGLLYSAR